MYEAKKGYANWYFNELAQDKLLAAAKKHGDFAGVPGKWVIDGKFDMADRNGPMKVEVRREQGRREGVDEDEHRDDARAAQARPTCRDPAGADRQRRA